jgi:aryl-alcohol dehydrogenase-like predicted oxidoreductase
MRTRKLGNTGITVSELALGTWGLSGDGYGPVADQDQDAVIDRALQLGISAFETSDVYGRGRMEQRLAERLPDSAVVITKIGTDRSGKPPRKRFDREFLEQSLERCRERLKRDTLDVVLLHNPSVQCLRRGEAQETMAAQVALGRVRAWGLSAGDAEVVNEALTAKVRPAVVQLAYNALFSQDVSRVQQDLETHGVGLLARSVLAHGLLSGFWASNRRFSRDDHRVNRWTQDQFERRLKELQALRTAVSKDVPTVRSVALRYVLDNTAVSAAIIGPRSVLQLDQLVREAGREPPYLDDQARQRLGIKVNELGALE